MPEALTVVRLTKPNRPAGVDALAAAFAEDPMWKAILPDDAERARAMPPMWKGVIAYCHVYGAVHTTADVAGVAAWSAPGKAHVNAWRALRAGYHLFLSMTYLGPTGRARFLTAMRWVEARHKRAMPEPHWYLWALGVAPERQGRGIGGRLIEPILERADIDGTPCYLETQTERNVSFYRRRGFELVDHETEPTCGFPIWALSRPPGASRSSGAPRPANGEPVSGGGPSGRF